MSTYRMAVVGTGYIGLEHIKAIHGSDRSRLHTIAGSERSLSCLKELQARYGAERITARYEDVVSDDAVDAVYLCTPNRLHADQAVAALKAGKHVFCEKPLTSTLEGCRQIVQAAREAGGAEA